MEIRLNSFSEEQTANAETFSSGAVSWELSSMCGLTRKLPVLDRTVYHEEVPARLRVSAPGAVL